MSFISLNPMKFLNNSREAFEARTHFCNTDTMVFVPFLYICPTISFYTTRKFVSCTAHTCLNPPAARCI